MVSVSEQMSQKIHEYLKDMGLIALSREKKAFFYKPTSDHCQERELIVASLVRVLLWWWGWKGVARMWRVRRWIQAWTSVVKTFRNGIIVGKVFWL